MNLLTVIGLVLSMIIGLWKFFSGRNRRKREILKEVKKTYEETKPEETNKIISDLDRINRT